MKITSMPYQPEFRTHTCPEAETLHAISEAILLPGRLSMQLLARSIHPLPGKNKDSYLLGLAIRVATLAAFTLMMPLALTTTIIGFSLRCIDHCYRPQISYINCAKTAPPPLLLTKENPLSVRTHNLGFVSSSMSVLGDLRPPEERAKEVVQSIIGDPHKPDIIFFQEAFHEDATRILCEGIKEEYPYIIHNVRPHLSGFSSGTLVASKYPPKEVEFEQFSEFLGPEALTPRGIARVELESTQGPLFIYGVHTQALNGEERAASRIRQIDELQEMIAKDRGIQVVCGDFNTSRISIWGDDNAEPKNQAEVKVLERFSSYFNDLFLKDHDEKTGQRISGTPKYLAADNARMNEELSEPSGSWYYGPLADKGFILYWKLHFDRLLFGRDTPTKLPNIGEEPSGWGTNRWHAKQIANTARLDYILLPKNSQNLDGRVEIRRTIVPKDAQSSSSDHLPVDGRVWVVNHDASRCF